MLVDLFLPKFAARSAFLRRSMCLRAPADDDFGTAELDLFQQGLEPGFELVIEIVHEDDLGFGDIFAVGE